MKPRLALLLAGLALICGTALAANNRADACDKLWLEDSGPYVNQAVPDYTSLLKWWRAQEKDCAGTVTYEARLALIHYYLDDYAEARRVLAGIHDRKSPYYYLSEFIAVTIDVTEIDGLPPAEQPEAFKKGRARLEQFTQRYPDSAAGFNMLASMLAYLEDWHAALRALDQTQKLITPEVSKMGMFRNYTIVYTELGRHDEAINAAAEAMDYTTSLQADPPFMLALMRSYVALERIDEAQKVVQTLVDRVPGVHQTPEFQRAVLKMKELKDAAKASKPADRK